VDSHEKVLGDKGFSEEKILAAVGVASVVYAIGVVLDTEQVAPASLSQPSC
jgi:lipoyl-dependent peroxiredoxin subunit D